MAIETFKTVVSRFLAEDSTDVLALKGAWGVGKTYHWKKIVEKNKNQIKLPKYSYVSLFGITSLSELRIAIFVKTQEVAKIETNQDRQIACNKWVVKVKKCYGFCKKSFSKSFWGHKSIKEIDVRLPYFGNIFKSISVGMEAIAPHLISETLICLDDFERLNDNRIQPDELLGFISELKTQKKCKVVLIFNEEKLGTKEDDYRKYREKVIDIELLFAPTAAENAEVAFPADLPNRKAIKEYAVSLDIKNIRILKKIVELTVKIHKEVGALHAGVMEQAVKTLVFLVWSYYDSSAKKPPFDFIKKWNSGGWRLLNAAKKRQFNKEAPKAPEPDEEWANVLHNYGLFHMDEFDLAISRVIEQGHLEETGLSEKAIQLQDSICKNERANSFHAAQKLLHCTFSDNENELVKGLTDSFKQSARHLGLDSLNWVVIIFRQLGLNGNAEALINFHMDARKSEKDFFNLENYPFSQEIDPSIREQADRKYAELHEPPSLLDTVKQIHTNGSWSNEHIQVLKKASVDDFFNLFKLEEHQENLKGMIKVCLKFRNSGDESISQNAYAALIRIGNENRLNRIRVERYGISINSPDAIPHTEADN